MSHAFLVAGVEADPVAEGGGDVGVAKRHHLKHLLDLRLQDSQQLLHRLSCSHLSIHAEHGRPALTNIHFYILKRILTLQSSD